MNTHEKYKRFMITEFLSEVDPVAVESAQGVDIVAEDGLRYLDAFAGISACNAGHGCADVIEAARRQMERLVHCGTYLHPNAPAADLAELLAAITPGRLSKTFFGNGGAEANEAAIRLAKQATGRTEFIALQGSFHGRSLATLSLSGVAGRKRGGGPYMPGVAFAPAPYCYRCPLELRHPACNLACARAIEGLIATATSGAVAAMILEPIQGEGGIVVPPPGYLRAVKEILDRHQALLIVDEVQTGFGRTGWMFAVEAEEIEPDLMTLGKGIANGLPLSALITRPEIAAAFRPGDHLSTFGGNPVCCAAAIATIGFHRHHNLAHAAREKGDAFLKDLRRRLSANPRVGEIRGRGLMIGVELVQDASGAPSPDLARHVRAACRDNGVLIGVGGLHGNVLRIQPPLVISDGELARVAETVGKALH